MLKKKIAVASCVGAAVVASVITKTIVNKKRKDKNQITFNNDNIENKEKDSTMNDNDKKLFDEVRYYYDKINNDTEIIDKEPDNYTPNNDTEIIDKEPDEYIFDSKGFNSIINNIDIDTTINTNAIKNQLIDFIKSEIMFDMDSNLDECKKSLKRAFNEIFGNEYVANVNNMEIINGVSLCVSKLRANYINDLINATMESIDDYSHFYNAYVGNRITEKQRNALIDIVKYACYYINSSINNYKNEIIDYYIYAVKEGVKYIDKNDKTKVISVFTEAIKCTMKRYADLLYTIEINDTQNDINVETFSFSEKSKRDMRLKDIENKMVSLSKKVRRDKLINELKNIIDEEKTSNEQTNLYNEDNVIDNNKIIYEPKSFIDYVLRKFESDIMVYKSQLLKECKTVTLDIIDRLFGTNFMNNEHNKELVTVTISHLNTLIDDTIDKVIEPYMEMTDDLITPLVEKINTKKLDKLTEEFIENMVKEQFNSIKEGIESIKEKMFKLYQLNIEKAYKSMAEKNDLDKINIVSLFTSALTDVVNCSNIIIENNKNIK